MNDVIIRGTTPTFKYTFKQINPAQLVSAYLTIMCRDRVMIEKDLSTATVGDKFLSWKLSQDETLSLFGHDAFSQLNWKLPDGTRGASLQAKLTVANNEKEVVI